MSNWRTIMAVDFDKWACATYAANFPDVDVRCDTVADVMDELPACDVIIGGPPCQSFSRAGKGEGGDGEVNAWPEAIEAVRRTRPRQFLFENVPGMLDAKHRPYAAQVYAELESLGYRMDHAELDAVNFGVPQFRKRLWYWGIRDDVDGSHCWPVPTHAWPWPEPSMFGCELQRAVTCGWALDIAHMQRDGVWFDGSGDELWTGWMDDTQASSARYRQVRDFCEPATTQVGGGHCFGGRRLVAGVAVGDVVQVDPKHPHNTPDQPDVTQRSGGNGHSAPGHCTALTIDTKQHRTERGIDEPAAAAADDRRHYKADGVYVRRLTPHECARLQSCPDDMVWPEGITKTAMYRIIGNGWACALAARMSEALATADPQSRTVLDLFCGGGLAALGWHGRYWAYAN